MGDWWIVICGWGALLLRVGFALHDCGSLRSKSSAGAVLRNVADLAVAALAFWAVGQAVLATEITGARPVFAWRQLFATPKHPGMFYVMAVTLIATAIPVGVVGERSRFWPMLALSILMAGVVVPLALRWTIDGGWLERQGFRDHAGAAALHLVGAVFAAAGSVFVGPRTGKYNRDGSSNAIPGHSVPLASIGVLLLLVGWFPYVLGMPAAAAYGDGDFPRADSLLGRMAMNVALAGAAGTLASLLFSRLRYGKPDIHLTYAGLLGALVAVTAGAALGEAWKAVLVGAVAGVLVPVVVLVIDLLWKIDDPTGAIAVHGVGALWGLVAVGLLGTVNSFADRLKLMMWQVLGVLAVAAFAAVVAVALMLILRSFTALRSKEADEFDGLDLAEHDIGAYPDFQQTMIKSYHLREA